MAGALGTPSPSRFPYPGRPDQRGVAPASGGQVVRARLVIVYGPTGAIVGVFVYQPGTTPAHGNPPVAWMTAATSDPYGNPVQPQIGSQAANGQGVLLQGANLVFRGSAATGNKLAALSAIPATGTNMSSFLVINGPTDSTLEPVFELAGESQDTTISPYAHVFQVDGSGNQSPMPLWASGGVFISQPGAPLSAETFHPITLDAGWTAPGIAGYASPRYQLMSDGINLQLSGIASAAFFAASKTLNAGNPLPAAYQPKFNADYYSGDAVGNRCHISISTTGVITAHVPTGVSSGTLFAEINGIVPLV